MNEGEAPLASRTLVRDPAGDRDPARLGISSGVLARAQQMGPRAQGLAVFACYLALSYALWGVHLLPRLGSSYLSDNWSDVRFYAWCLGWWPHAILHGWNPLHAGGLWAPAGVNMVWLTGLPGPSLLFAPVTLAFGPLVSENVLFLLAPALAGWAAYLLCRRVTARFWPAVAGGYVFGFSTFTVVEMSGHLNLALDFPVPLAVYLVLRRLDGDLGRARFAGVLALALLGEFSISTEIFATMTIVGGLAYLGAVAFAERGRRASLLAVGGEIGVVYVIALVAVSPYLVAMLHAPHPFPLFPVAGATPALAYHDYVQHYSVDLLSFVMPGHLELVGAGAAASVTSHFKVAGTEDAAYLGLPLLLVLILFGVTERRRRSTWLLLALLVGCATLALGPTLQVDGTLVASLPSQLITRLPLISQALPARMMVFAWLTLGLIVAIWLAPATPSTRRSTWLRWALVILGALAILPSVPAPTSAAVPAFFSDGIYRRYLQPGETVLAIPFYVPNESMPWQVAGGYGFALAGGYVGFRAIPASARGPALRGLLLDRPELISPPALSAFLVGHHVQAIVLPEVETSRWDPLLSTLRVTPAFVGGLWLYELPSSG